MKKVLTICLVLMLAATTVGAQHVIDDKDKPEFLFVLSAESGTYENSMLTLKGVPLVIYFSDRPNRIAGHMSLKKFVELWEKGSDSFKADPPNAILSIFDDQGNKNAVVELMNPKLMADGLMYRVTLIDGELPETFGKSSVFIDDIVMTGGGGPNSSPFNFDLGH